MKAAVILAIAGLAASQNLSGEPACATSCLSSAISKAGCHLDDQACQCGPTQSAIGSLAAPCLLGACAVSDLIIAQSVGSQLCAIYSSGIATATATTTTTTGSATSSSTLVITSTTSSSTASTSTSESKSSTSTATSSATTEASGTTSSSAAATTSATSSKTANLAAAATPVFVGALAAVMGVVAAM